MAIHQGLAGGKWRALGLIEQFANVGSEVDRAIRAWESGQSSRFQGAFERALELFDLTARDGRWRGHRLREILRAREEFVRLFHGDGFDAASAAGLRRYFLAFAIEARKVKSRESA